MKRRFIKWLSIPLIVILIASGIYSIPIGVVSSQVAVEQSNKISIITSSYEMNQGQSFTINIVVEPIENIAGVQFDLAYNPKLISIQRVTEGDFLKQELGTFFNAGKINNELGLLTDVYGTITGKGFVTKTGTFATIEATANYEPGTCVLTFNKVILGNTDAKQTIVSFKESKISITESLTTISLKETTVNKYEYEYKGTIGTKIIIGNTENTSDFKPNIEIQRWGEVGLKLIADSNLESKSELLTSVATETKTVIASNGSWIFEFNPTTKVNGFNEFGGMDIIITAKEKPLSNRIVFTYNSSDVIAYYQPPLIDIYKDGWSEEFQDNITVTETKVTGSKGNIIVYRPIHIVGSIALYSNTKSDYVIGDINYGPGKIGNLYSMQVEDTWARWSVEDRNIVLTIPQYIIDKGIYPIVIRPIGDTFGYTTQGGTAWENNGSYMRCSGDAFDGPNGTVTAIAFYGRYSGSAANAQMAIYKDSSSAPGALLTNGATNAVAVSSSNSWNSASFTTNPTTTNEKYYLMHNHSGVVYYYGDSGGTLYWKYKSQNYNSWPDPAGSMSNVGSAVRGSIYATYTPTATYSITNSSSSKAWGVVESSTTYYAGGGSYSNPVTDGECSFTLTNSGSTAKINAKSTNPSGGVGWTLTSNAPGENTVRISLVYSGQNPASPLILTTSDQQFIASLAAGTIKWDEKLETGTFTDGVEKAWTITLTAVAP